MKGTPLGRRVSTSVLVKGAALLVFVAAVAGATYGVQQVLGGGHEYAAVQPEAAHATLNTTAGQNVTFAVTLRNLGSDAVTGTARVVGQGVDVRSPQFDLAAGESRTAFITLAAPAEVGEHSLDLRVESADGVQLRSRSGYLTLRVLPPSVGVTPGDEVLVVYTGRFADSGRVFNSNDQALLDKPFPRSAEYRAGQGPLTVKTSPPSVVPGFYEGILGMQAGESRTFTFPEEKGYGPAAITQEVPRDEVLQRQFNLSIRTETVGIETFDDYVERTDQGAGADFAVGDIFRFEQGPNRWPYLIVGKDAEAVQYRLAVQVNESYTLYPFWEGASLVVAVNETMAQFYTTPTTEANATFTMKSFWPNMASVKSMNESTIVARHSPPEGFKFTQPATEFEPAREATVTLVTDEAITVTVPSSDPLAGHPLTFDVTVLEIRR